MSFPVPQVQADKQARRAAGAAAKATDPAYRWFHHGGWVKVTGPPPPKVKQ